MKVLSALEMRAVEERAFKQGANADQFMQQAGRGIAGHIQELLDPQMHPDIILVAGSGNNAGDGYCALLDLYDAGYKVRAIQLTPFEKCSQLCQKYSSLFREKGGEIQIINDASHLCLDGLILDGLLGTGYQGALVSLYKKVIEAINTSSSPVYAIDIPSGLNGNTGQVLDVAVVANTTFYLGCAKTGFFLDQGWNHVGKLMEVSFGIDPLLIDEAQADFTLLDHQEARLLLPPIENSRHKYQAGFVAGFAGSAGMEGAALLSGMGALKAGAGIVKIAHLGEMGFCSQYPELIHQCFEANQIDQAVENFQKATAFYLGPGLQVSPDTIDWVEGFLTKLSLPCVIDADALNIMAEKKIAPKKGAILTPHCGEAKRLLGVTDNHLLHSACQDYVDQYDVILILKGGPTFIFQKGHLPVVNVTGDPGMATAGAGDVLTGICAGLLSQQKMSPASSALLAVYLHGLSGEIAAEEKTSYSLVASDLFKSLHLAFHILRDS